MSEIYKIPKSELSTILISAMASRSSGESISEIVKVGCGIAQGWTDNIEAKEAKGNREKKVVEVLDIDEALRQAYELGGDPSSCVGDIYDIAVG